MALGLLGTAVPSALADQSGAGRLRVTVGSARLHVNGLAAGPASNATCTINKITINRYSECEWVAIHVDVIKVIEGKPAIEGTVDFDVKHQMALNAKSAIWSEKFTVSKAKTTRAGTGVAVDIAAASGGGTKATVRFAQGRILSSGAASGSIGCTTGPIATKKVNPKAKTPYTYTFTKPGYTPGTVSYDSVVYRCDNFFGTTGCAIPEVPTGLVLFDSRASTRASTSCAPAANLPANQRTIGWVNRQENNSQGGAITIWRRQFHVMAHDPST
ncbi:hypothetical protein [Streptomyces sp. NPDC007205]|uniref:hypothetical protein n=1 Tax=Streptomyces sp. NPDC007205 TaxID=3154316 RepID=UPI0033D4EF23